MNIVKTKLILIAAIILIASVISFGQTKKQVPFFSYHLSEYNKPIMVSTGKYQAYFKNMGESREKGQIIIDETTKIFTIKWLNGDDWVAKFTKKEKKTERDELFGDVIRITYSGKWVDENIDCIFTITETNSSGCIAALKTRKVVDTDYGINTWKKTFVFGIRGECF